MIPVTDIIKCYQKIRSVNDHTPLELNQLLSERYACKVYLKREDLQRVRSYKSRGAYNKMLSLSDEQKTKGVVCASAGNHAQGFAYACSNLGIKGKIFMPVPTPKQKINQVNFFGKSSIEIELYGDTFDDAYAAAKTYCEEKELAFIHPFNDLKVIEGQGTVGFEIIEDTTEEIDILFVPVGGGGVSAGVGSYFKQVSPSTKIIGVEPKGAPAMQKSLAANEIIELNDIDKFVDGAAVKKIGALTFEIAKQVIDEMALVHEGKICSTILEMYNQQAIVVEPAGALTIAVLDQYADKIKGKNIVCLVSGGNNDILRTEEIKERSMLYEGLKHYFVIRFPQRSGALKEFVNEILGPNDSISRFEYTKRNNRETGPAIVGIELQNKDDLKNLLANFESHNFKYQQINENPDLFNLLV